MIKALERADLGADPHRRQGADPAQAPQPGDRLGEDRLASELLELGLDPVAAGQRHVVGVHVVGRRQP
jgi:hypothetical protein